MTPSRPHRILWLESGDLYTVRRGTAAGRDRGVIIDNAEMADLMFKVENGSARVAASGKDLLESYDAVIVRTFVPWISEALTIARLFRDAGKIVVDHSLTEEGYSISKMHDYLILAQHGIPVPDTWQFYDYSEVIRQSGELGYPFILKGIHGSQGQHVHLVRNGDELRRRFSQYRPGELLLQEYLEASEDYRVMVIGYQAVPVIVRRQPRAGEFRTNFEFNEQVIPLPASEFPLLTDLAERAARVLRREFAGVDIRFRGKAPLILEVNRRPGFKGFEEATGYDVAGALVEYVKRRCYTIGESLTSSRE